MSGAGHNYLAALAADIRALHSGIRRNAEQVARDAIEAGNRLIEAKSLVQHGEWEAWLREHAAISPRTAQRYMRMARSGLKSDTLADLGLAAAADAVSIDAERIRIHARRAWANLMAAGLRLGEVKDEIGDDRLHQWAEAEFGWSAGDVEQHIAIARAEAAGDDVAPLLKLDGKPFCLRFVFDADELAALREAHPEMFDDDPPAEVTEDG